MGSGTGQGQGWGWIWDRDADRVRLGQGLVRDWSGTGLGLDQGEGWGQGRGWELVRDRVGVGPGTGLGTGSGSGSGRGQGWDWIRAGVQDRDSPTSAAIFSGSLRLLLATLGIPGSPVGPGQLPGAQDSACCCRVTEACAGGSSLGAGCPEWGPGCPRAALEARPSESCGVCRGAERPGPARRDGVLRGVRAGRRDRGSGPLPWREGTPPGGRLRRRGEPSCGVLCFTASPQRC